MEISSVTIKVTIHINKTVFGRIISTKQYQLIKYKFIWYKIQTHTYTMCISRMCVFVCIQTIWFKLMANCNHCSLCNQSHALRYYARVLSMSIIYHYIGKWLMETRMIINNLNNISIINSFTFTNFTNYY